jgi:hypothetical protein
MVTNHFRQAPVERFSTAANELAREQSGVLCEQRAELIAADGASSSRSVSFRFVAVAMGSTHFEGRFVSAAIIRVRGQAL